MALAVMVTPASPHDSIPARDQLFRLRLTHPELAVAWADSAYGGTLIDWSHSFLDITLKTVPRRKDSGRIRRPGKAVARRAGDLVDHESQEKRP